MTTQIDLFDKTYASRINAEEAQRRIGANLAKLFNDPSHKLARNQDPQTSHAAARQVNVFANTHYRAIYEALQTMKDGTFYEIAERSGLEPSSVWRRLNEMEKDGMIQPTGEERRGPTNRLCRVWKAK